jgi:hypothetical protein
MVPDGHEQVTCQSEQAEEQNQPADDREPSCTNLACEW